ncbi:hypothetical protein EVAR_68234_1 [Eumeta japonica]|uniref:Uncharacterized protein n=1 Tax=Eumeta variegata TaxID=151549 RepID=A0A4C1ZTP3_EUMVA|nr:hypothetical protein EVAR_68234_1 [Eumeta japonica]
MKFWMLICRYVDAASNCIPLFCYHHLYELPPHYGSKFKDVFTPKQIHITATIHIRTFEVPTAKSQRRNVIIKGRLSAPYARLLTWARAHGGRVGAAFTPV